MAIDYAQFIHPEDRAALERLQAIPLLDTAARKFMAAFTEDMMHGINMASKVRLGPGQLSRVYRMLEEVCEELQLELPEFYLDMDPQPNAYTAGDTRPFVVITSGIVDLLERHPEELKAVISHECGHILCHHVLYHMLADWLVSAGSGVGAIFGAGIISEPLRWALMYWVRRSEFSADRVAAYVMKDADVVARTMLRLAGGPSRVVGELDLDLFLGQAAEYDRFMEESEKSKAMQNWIAKDLSHPYPAVRAAEVRKWFVRARRLVLPNAAGGIRAQKLDWGT